MKIILLGSPGAGKGTLANQIKTCLNICHISTGDLLRQEIKQKTELGIKLKSIIESGELVTDDIMLAMIKNKTLNISSYILDGFPRTEKQAISLEKLISIDIVFYLHLDNEIALKRLSGRLVCSKCNANYNKYFSPPNFENVCDQCEATLISRKDDTEEIVKNRLKVYHSKIENLLNFYQKKGILTQINADNNKKAVFNETLSIIQSTQDK